MTSEQNINTFVYFEGSRTNKLIVAGAREGSGKERDIDGQLREKSKADHLVLQKH